LKLSEPAMRMVGEGALRTMSGAHLRRARLFNAASGRAFTTAFDHGITLGPKPPGVRSKLGQKVLSTAATCGKPVIRR
jgi:DhnA family fructose-bisphosphate aldolase class Ia